MESGVCSGGVACGVKNVKLEARSELNVRCGI